MKIGIKLGILVCCNELEIYLDYNKNNPKEIRVSWIPKKKFKTLRSLIGKWDRKEEINLGIILKSKQVTIISLIYKRTNIVEETLWWINNEESETELMNPRDNN